MTTSSTTPLQPHAPVAPARTLRGARSGRRPRFYRYQPVPPVGYDDEGYPCEDSAVQSFAHADLSTYLMGALSTRFAGRALVWMDAPLLYRQGDRSAVMAPDVLVAFNKQPPLSRSDARAYKLWERPLPEFVLEVLSPSTSRNDLTDKKYTYATLGVREYWLVDPGGRLMGEELAGHRLRGQSYQRLACDGKGRLASSVLGVELRIVEDAASDLAEPAAREREGLAHSMADGAEEPTLRFFDLESGEILRSHAESEAARSEAETALKNAEQRIAELQAALNKRPVPTPDTKSD